MTEHTLAIHLADELADAVGHVAPSLFLTSGHGHRAATATVVEAHHLVASDHLLPQSETVTLTGAEGAEIQATIVGRDRLTDLALLRTEATLTPLPLAEGQARPGQLVVSVGLSWRGLVAHPGFVTSASGPHETRSGLRLERLIDTNLSPFSGFSGGPLVNGRGALDDTSDDADFLLVDAEDIRAAHLVRPLVAGRVVVTLGVDGDIGETLATWDLHGWAVVPPSADPHVLNSAAASAVDGLAVTSARRRRAEAGAATPTVALATDRSEVSVEALTPRERTVLELMADGLSNKQIAARLAITDHTAKFHVASILGKLGVTTRAAAVRRGLRRGWVSF